MAMFQPLRHSYRRLPNDHVAAIEELLARGADVEVQWRKNLVRDAEHRKLTPKGPTY